uniref:Essential protein Yae1 N-terminal domain-containing protein n=1 Tax=Moniliophthora roreri TaxID=221103 RepID=A0A0W0FGZ5_MONRR
MPTEYIANNGSYQDDSRSWHDQSNDVQDRELVSGLTTLSVLAQALGENPATIEAFSRSGPKPRSEEKASSKGKKSRRPRRVPSALEEYLKSIKARSDELESEFRRADEAVSRAESAEARLKDAFTEIITAETARARVELNLIRSEEQVEWQNREIERLKQALGEARDQAIQERQKKVEAERALHEARHKVREARNNLRIQEARERGREEGIKVGMLKQFNDKREDVWESGYGTGYEEGRADGYEEGQSDGWNEGLKHGVRQGLSEGREKGRAEERARALNAFDRFIREEIENRNEASHYLSVHATTSDRRLLSEMI